MENEPELALAVNHITGLALPREASLAGVRAALKQWIDNRLAGDLETVIRLLYQVDVDEQRLKYLLREKVGEDAAGVMADLIIDRQLAKLAYRQAQKNAPPPPETGDDGTPLERW
ncbi:MAG: hypothetical protein QM664_04605 [Flavihumibacter sp.]